MSALILATFLPPVWSLARRASRCHSAWSEAGQRPWWESSKGPARHVSVSWGWSSGGSSAISLLSRVPPDWWLPRSQTSRHMLTEGSRDVSPEMESKPEASPFMTLSSRLLRITSVLVIGLANCRGGNIHLPASPQSNKCQWHIVTKAHGLGCILVQLSLGTAVCRNIFSLFYSIF